MLVESSLWRLGVGVLVGWVALWLLLALTRRGKAEAPAAYYRALVRALALAAALIPAPSLRAWSGLELELGTGGAQSLWRSPAVLTFATDWGQPLLASPERPWPATPLAWVLSGVGLTWLAVLGVGVLRSVRGRMALWRAYRAAASAPPLVLARAHQLALELGIRTPELRVVDDIGSAFSFGLIAPIIVLDAGACRLGAELDFILRHELLHVARSDTRSAFWIDLAQRCFTGHPALRQLAAEIRFAREACVDEAAAGDKPVEYARFLLGAAERRRSVAELPSALVSMADTALERRIEMLMTFAPKQVPFLRSSSWVGSCGLALGALIFLAPASCASGHAASSSAPQRVQFQLPGEPQVRGSLSPDQVQEVVRGPQGQGFVDCYGRLEAPRPNLSFNMNFEVASDGHVRSGHVLVDAFPELSACLEGALNSLVFPSSSGGAVQVEYPLMLVPPREERQARDAQSGSKSGLPRQVIRKVLQDSFGRLRVCYEQLPEPRPATRINMEFTIGREGSVTEGQVRSQYPELGQCVDDVMRSLVFPAPDRVVVAVDYPVAFSP